MSEIEAMGAIDSAMKDLENDEQLRVLRWANDKFGGGVMTLKTGGGGRVDGDLDGGGGEGEQRFARIADLMDTASPTSTVDHVLVASYWFQVVQGTEDFGSQEVNGELKDLGQASKNITDSYSTLMARKPPAVRQVQKSGNTRQARKRYRLTEPGVRAVERMLRGETTED